MKWETLRQNKNDGGLGFRDLHCYNKALLAKQAWRMLINPDSLWTMFPKELYFPNKNLMEAKYNNNSSWLWKNIIKRRDLLKQGIRWEVSNGENINLWEDKWIPTIKRMKITTNKPSNNLVEKVSDVIKYPKKEWDEDKLKEHIIEEEIREITKIFINQHTQEDKIIWQYDKKRQYIVKSGYYVEVSKGEEEQAIRNNEDENIINNQNARFLWEKLWQLNIPIKIKHFIWKLCNNALPTKDNSIKRNINVDPKCSCLGDNGTILHNCVTCLRVVQLWHASSLLIRSTNHNENNFKD